MEHYLTVIIVSLNITQFVHQLKANSSTLFKETIVITNRKNAIYWVFLAPR